MRAVAVLVLICSAGLSGPRSDRDPALRQAQGENEEVFVFGGGQIFREAVEKGLVDRLYLTLVKGDYDADTFFPDYSEFTKVLEQEEKTADGYTYTFLTLEK